MLKYLGIAIVAVMLVLGFAGPASADGVVPVNVQFDGFEDDTPSTELGIGGVQFQSPQWLIRNLTTTPANPYINGAVLRNRETFVGGVRELVIDFENPQNFIKFSYITVGDFDPNIRGFKDGAEVFNETFDSVPEPMLGSAHGGFVEVKDVEEFTQIVFTLETSGTDVVIDDISTDGGLADGRLNNNPGLDLAPAFVLYCDDRLLVRDPDFGGEAVIVLPLTTFQTAPASGVEEIAEGGGNYVEQDSNGFVFVTGFLFDPYWPNNGKPYVIRMRPDCSEATNVSPRTVAEYNP